MKLRIKLSKRDWLNIGEKKGWLDSYANSDIDESDIGSGVGSDAPEEDGNGELNQEGEEKVEKRHQDELNERNNMRNQYNLQVVKNKKIQEQIRNR
jgi:hypothetical protein